MLSKIENKETTKQTNNSILGLLLAVYSHIQSNLEGQHDNNCFKKITSAYIFTSEFISCKL